jgi:hypothetical protein
MDIEQLQNAINNFIKNHPTGYPPSIVSTQEFIDYIGLDYKITEDDRVVDVIALIQIHISKLILDDYIENVRNIK